MSVAKCPKCGYPTAVRDKRNTAEHITRRRHCPKCDERVTTYEITTEQYHDLMEFRKYIKRVANQL
jgi:transcriptional regulator NrdR family protein